MSLFFSVSLAFRTEIVELPIVLGVIVRVVPSTDTVATEGFDDVILPTPPASVVMVIAVAEDLFGM